jgi:NADH-quinone oxidoreductase subunit L
MFRLLKMTFFGEFRGTEEQLHHVHESPSTMTIPLMVLATGAIFAGYWGVPKFLLETLHLGESNGFERFLEPIFLPLANGWQPVPEPVVLTTEWALMGLSVLIAGIGIAIGWFFYSGAYPFAWPARIAGALGPLYRLVRDKYRIDELYEAVFVNGLIKKFGRFLWELDARVVDGAVNGSRHVTVGLSDFSSWIDKTFVDGAVNGVGDTFQAAFRGMRRVQTGQTQTYAMTMAFGIFGLVCVYLILS